jgi:hypothetical protein
MRGRRSFIVSKAEAHRVFRVIQVNVVTQCCIKRVFMLSDQISEQQFSFEIFDVETPSQHAISFANMLSEI